jgi:hypothetical protein
MGTYVRNLSSWFSDYNTTPLGFCLIVLNLADQDQVLVSPVHTVVQHVPSHVAIGGIDDVPVE